MLNDFISLALENNIKDFDSFFDSKYFKQFYHLEDIENERFIVRDI